MSVHAFVEHITLFIKSLKITEWTAIYAAFLSSLLALWTATTWFRSQPRIAVHGQIMPDKNCIGIWVVAKNKPTTIMWVTVRLRKMTGPNGKRLPDEDINIITGYPRNVARIAEGEVWETVAMIPELSTGGKQGRIKCQEAVIEVQDSLHSEPTVIKIGKRGFMMAHFFHAPKPLSDAQSFKCDSEDAEDGDARAQCNLGIRYTQGKGVETNNTEAVKWFHKAAEQELAEAQYNLGVCYKHGRGVDQSNAEALKWCRKAAEQGYAPAQFSLGHCYDTGEDVEQNYDEAVKWYRKAAEQGDAMAQCCLGAYYRCPLGECV